MIPFVIINLENVQIGKLNDLKENCVHEVNVYVNNKCTLLRCYKLLSSVEIRIVYELM